MNTTKCATAMSNLRVLSAFLCALSLLTGCATTRPGRYFLRPGAIGVAVISAPTADLATVKRFADDGLVGGLIAPLALGPLGVFVWPFVAPITTVVGVTRGTTCDQRLDAAYPNLPEKYVEIVQREFSLADAQDQFAVALRKLTAAPIVEVAAPHGVDDAVRQQQLLATAAQRALGHLFLVKIVSIRLEPDLDNHCDSWKVSINMGIELWNVTDRKLMHHGPLGYGKFGAPFVKGQWSELELVLDEPGALHARLMPVFDAAGTSLIYESSFLLPP